MIDTKVGCITNENHPDIEIISEAARVLQTGGLVAFPTETVYGLGGNGLDEQVAKRIYEAKGRPSDNPLIIHIAEAAALDDLVTVVSETGKQLMEAFWPGPLTLIFPKSAKVPYGTTGGLETVAIRMPSHPVALALIKEAGLPIAAPSANASGRPSPTECQHVIEDLSGKISYIIDGGQVGLGLESTIVDLSGTIPVILRPGCITLEMLQEVVPEVVVDPGIQVNCKDDVRPKAPGMKYKHYAPKAEMVLYDGDLERITAQINAEAEILIANGLKVGIIATEETVREYHQGCVKSMGSRQNVAEIAHNLYRILREFDASNVDKILSEAIPEDALGQAVMNRLNKAAGYHIERL